MWYTLYTMAEKTTIRVAKTTQTKLQDLKLKLSSPTDMKSFDKVIIFLIEFYKEHGGKADAGKS